MAWKDIKCGWVVGEVQFPLDYNIPLAFTQKKGIKRVEVVEELAFIVWCNSYPKTNTTKGGR